MFFGYGWRQMYIKNKPEQNYCCRLKKPHNSNSQTLIKHRIMTKIPPSFLKSLDEIAIANFYEAKQRYILHLGESLIMHLSSFVLAEYRDSGLTYLKVEKEIFNMKKSLSLGVYVGWIRDTAQFLDNNNKQSRIHDLLMKPQINEEFSRFINSFETFKKALETSEGESVLSTAEKLLKNASTKQVSMNDFLNAFVQLRNKIAHPIYEVKSRPGKMISWPFNDEYYSFILPPLESGVKRMIDELRGIWEYDQFVVSEVDKEKVILNEENGSLSKTLPISQDVSEELKVLINNENHLLVNDWSALLKPKQEALNAIQEEQEQIKKIGSLAELKNNVVHCLDDGQISVDEFKFLESITKSKLHMSSDELREFIMSAANEIGIENPFPEVDNRFIEAIDKAIKSKSYNDLILKLIGEQYGVTAGEFDKHVDSRAYALGLSPSEARQSDNYNFDSQELKLYQSLAMSRMWLMSIAKLNEGNNFKIDGDSRATGTKEYWHKFAFKSVQNYVEHKLKKLQQAGGLEWTTKQNQWQIGNMTSYAWCSFYPLNAPTKAALALHVSAYSDGSIAIGFLPDWKDQRDLDHFGLLQYHTRLNLQRFFKKYNEELKKYPDLVLWNRITETSYAPIIETLEKYPWYFETDYHFEQIQFFQAMTRTLDHPAIVSESFDIIFNLFNALIPEITNDYLNNLASLNDPLDSQSAVLISLCNSTKEILNGYLKDNSIIETTSEAKQGLIGIKIQEKKEGAPVILQMRFTADYSNSNIHFDIRVQCGNKHNEFHDEIDNILSTLALQVDGVERLYRHSCLIFRKTFSDISQHTDNVLVLVEQFLSNFTISLAKNNIQILGLKPQLRNEEEWKSKLTPVLDELIQSEQHYFSNSIKKERDANKNLLFLDYVSSNKKHGAHWLGYGIDWNDSQNPQWLMMMKLENSIEGSALANKMDEFSKPHDYELNYSGSLPDRSEAKWMIDSIVDDNISSSSDYNRNHNARLARLNSEHKYANWSAKICDTQQWIQVKLDSMSYVWEVAVQGRFNRDQWVTQFDIAISDDGKNWTKIAENCDGPQSGNDIVYFTFEKAQLAQYVRIIPLAWKGWISMRFDVKASPVQPNKITLAKRWSLVDASVDSILELTRKEINEVSNYFNGDFSIKSA